MLSRAETYVDGFRRLAKRVYYRYDITYLSYRVRSGERGF